MNELPNVTATEVLASLDTGIKRLAAFHTALVEPIVDAALAQLFMFGPTVCAKRARKLRKRGCQVRWVGRTSTGKARYAVMLRVQS